MVCDVRQGRASQIEDLGDGTIRRRGGDPEREARIMRHAREHGYPAPHVARVEDDALVLERVDGATMTRAIGTRPWTAPRQMALLARLHERLHAIAYDGAVLVHLDLH